MIRAIILSVLFCGALNLPCRGAIIFSESFGSPVSSPTPISSYSGYTNGVGLTFSGTGDVRNTTPSNNSGASGGGNVFLASNGTSTLQISGINTLGYASGSFGLSFGAFKSATASNLTELVVAYSTDNITFFNLSPSIPAQPTGTGTAIWRLLSSTPTNVPLSNSFSLRFTNTSSSSQIRLDDIVLTGTAVPEPSVVIFLGIIGTAGVVGGVIRKILF